MEKERSRNNVKLKMVHLPRYASSVNIPVEEVAVLFRCGKCQTAPLKPPVYTCRSGHLTCTFCFTRIEESGEKVAPDCYKCKEPLMGRNQLLEEVVRNLPIQTCTALQDCSAPLRESRSEQSLQLTLQDPSHLEKLEQARLEAEKLNQNQEGGDFRIESTTSLCTMHHRASHRPVMCPYPCGRIVTLSGLFPHFEFHHPKVLVSNVKKERPTVIDIRYEDVIAKEFRCHVFFVLHLDDGDDADNSRWTAAALLKVTRSSQDMLRSGLFISTLSVGRLANPLDNGMEPWFLAVWASSLYAFSPVTYTLIATNPACPNSVSFTGPLVSMHQSQVPEDIYARGQCLLIPPGLLREMKLGKNGLKLMITFHSDVPFPFRMPDCLDFPIDKQIYVPF